MKEKGSFYIGVDVGGTKISAGLMAYSGKILLRRKIPTPPNAKPKQLYDALKGLIDSILLKENILKTQLHGIGLGIPGIVGPNQKDILITPNIALTRYPLAEQLNKYFRVKVLLGNDVNLGMLAEKWVGVAKTHNNIIGIFLGTGVGGCIIINGRIYLGSQGAAAELGHMIIDQNSRIVNAGIFGSLEGLTSRRAIERQIRERIKSGKKSVVTKLTEGNLKIIKSSVIRESLKLKDKVVVDVMDHVSEVLGKACISLRHILNPDAIVFGGGVVEACGDYILPRIRKISQADPFFKGVDHCEIISSQLGDDAVILGAVAILKQDDGDIDFSGDYYPKMKMSTGQGVMVNNKIYKNNFYVRADGKIRKLGDKVIYRKLLEHGKIGSQILKKVCRRNPQMLIIGSGTKRVELNSDAKAFLRTENIELKILPKQKAVEFYNAFDKRKAMLIH